MDRAEYMRLRGELVTASEQLAVVRSEVRQCQDALQGWVNGLTTPLDALRAGMAHDLIDRLFALQQQATGLVAEEARFKRALAGVGVPPA